MRDFACTEGEPFRLDPEAADAVRRAAARLKVDLRPRFNILEEDERGLRWRNVVGTVQAGNTTLTIEPKTRPGTNDWIGSVLALLVGSDRVDVADQHASGQSSRRPDLWEALAARFAARLDRALRRDGPLLLLQHEHVTGTTLRGHLDVSSWLRSLPAKGHLFPTTVSYLSVDNEFTRALSLVALRMARSSQNSTTRSHLLRAAALLRPGLPEPTAVPPGVERLAIPPQWSVYAPAWSIAAAVIARRSLLAPQGTRHGVAVAVEAWPLLERLLELALASAVVTRRQSRPALRSGRQRHFALLTPVGEDAARGQAAVADGILEEAGSVIAIFEAKYRDYNPAEGPLREDVFQALSTARAAAAPIAVLVYPNILPLTAWEVTVPGGFPGRLAIVGLDLFAYRPGGEGPLGDLLLDACS